MGGTVLTYDQLWLSKVGKGWEMIKVNGSPLPTAKVKLYHKDTFSISSRSFTLFGMSLPSFFPLCFSHLFYFFSTKRRRRKRKERREQREREP